MDKHSIDILEFDKIRQLIRRYLTTPLGGLRVDRLGPVSDRQQLHHRRLLLKEMRGVLKSSTGLPLDGARDIRPALEMAHIEGSILEPKVLLDFLTTLQATERVQKMIFSADISLPELKELAKILEIDPNLKISIGKSIDSDGNIRDSASKQLGKIRQELTSLRGHIVGKIQNLLKKRNVQNILQEDFYTLIDGRYVLPIQSQHKARFKGIVHDRSDSGATVFIEPVEVVSMGNRLRELEVEERRECNRILRTLTSEVRQNYSSLHTNVEILADLDFLQAAARFAEAQQMIQPKVMEHASLLIRGGRHPLLLEQMRYEKVVPLDLEPVSSDPGIPCRIIVVTGPNTGGKTVVIKTVGLLVLMALSGLDIPAEEGTTIPSYSNVYADIGDEQSLEQNLSTFSAHMSQIIRIVKSADDRSLVLLDELGAGTDPVEGGALGIAILDELRKHKVPTLVTSHLDDLKVYAHLTENVENAAMQFDVETLEPTYQLVFGIAGESNALRIASRLGMPDSLIDRAEAELSGRESEQAGVLYRKLVTEVQTAYQDRKKASQERDQVTRLADEHRKMIQKLERERHDILHRARIQAKKVVEDAKLRVKQAEKELEEQRRRLEALSEQKPNLEQAKEVLREASAELSFAEEEPLLEHRIEKIDPNQLKPGDMVQVAGFMKPGKVMEIDRNKQEVRLALSSWEMTLSLKKLEQMAQPAATISGEQKAPQRQTSWSYEMPESPGLELHLRQMRVHEALPKLEKYLEDAYLSGLGEVRIVHGVGTGAMMRAVQNELRNHRLVKSYRLGGFGEGGGGVTVVTFKEK